MKLAPHNLCTGCTACISACPKNCIELVQEQDGFSYPKLLREEDCIQCGRCEKVCPLIEQEDMKSNPVAYAAYSNADELRKESSSGGVFSEIAKTILEKQGIVYGAAYDSKGRIVHIGIENIQELAKLRGAKYAQSELKDTFTQVKQQLSSGREVLFAGTPCQVGGLKAFLGKEYQNLISIDFVCHGIPSPKVWESYLQWQSEKENQKTLPVRINLRDKHSGWSRYQYSTTMEYKNHKFSCLNGENIFMKLFVGDYINRLSCTECQFKGYERVSDFTLGDFWGIWDIDQEMDDNKGTSLVLVQSEKGQSIWKQISKNLKVKEMTLEQASQQNPSLLVSSQAKENRNQIMQMAIEEKFDEIIECMPKPVIAKPSLLNRVKGKVKRILKS